MKDKSEERPPDPPPLLLRQTAFRNIWIANLVSSLGLLIHSVGASWTMVSLTSAPEMVALVQTAMALPMVLLSLAAGAVADNFDRRRVMIIAQVTMLSVATTLAVLSLGGLLTPWLLLALTFMLGCGSALNNPAWQASIGDLVPRRELAAAITLNGMSFNLARSLGPAIGGLVVGALGAAAAFALNAMSYVGLIVVLIRWKAPRAAAARERLDRAMAAGLRYVARSPDVAAVVGRCGAFGLAASAVQALLPLAARDLAGGGPEQFGLLLGAFGLGGVLGAFASRRLRSRASSEVIVQWAFVVFGTAALVTGVSRWMPFSLIALAVAGAAWVLALSTLNSTVQLSVPRWVMARVLSIYAMAGFGGMALGSWIWGLVAADRGVGTALCLSALAQAPCIALGLRFPLRSAEDLDPPPTPAAPPQS